MPPICHFLSFPTSSTPRFQCSPPCNVLDLECGVSRVRLTRHCLNCAAAGVGCTSTGMTTLGFARIPHSPGAEQGQIYSLLRRVCLRRLLMMQFTLFVRWTSVCLMLRRRFGIVVRPQMRPTTDSLPPPILSLLSRGAATLVLQRRALFINLRSIPL